VVSERFGHWSIWRIACLDGSRSVRRLCGRTGQSFTRRRRMRIAIDARGLHNWEELAGVGQYTYQLVRHVTAVDQRNAYRLVFNFIRDRHLPPPDTYAETGWRFGYAAFPRNG